MPLYGRTSAESLPLLLALNIPGVRGLAPAATGRGRGADAWGGRDHKRVTKGLSVVKAGGCDRLADVLTIGGTARLV